MIDLSTAQIVQLSKFLVAMECNEVRIWVTATGKYKLRVYKDDMLLHELYWDTNGWRLVHQPMSEVI